MQNEVQVGDRFPLTIRRMDINGAGIGYYRRKITFVTGALPDEVVVAEVTAVHDRYLEAKTHRVRKQSPDRVTPVDPNYGHVGGVELGALSYPAQLKFKTDVINQSLAKFKPAGWQHYDVRPTIGAVSPLHYRNKAQFPVRMVDGHVRAGLYKPGSHELVPLQTFATQRKLTMQVITGLCAIIERLQIPVYDEKANSGIIKTLVVRESAATGEVQVTFVTNSQKLPHKEKLLEAIATELPAVVSISQNVNKGRTSQIWGDTTTLLAGSQYITEIINGIAYNLSPQAFLQLNPEQTAVLYKEALAALDLHRGDKLVDAYCGVGTLGLALAGAAGSVRGMDTIPAAIEDAKANAERNGFTNTEYVTGKAEDVLPKWLDEGYRPDAVIVDPPRTGLEGAFIPALLRAKPKRFVYVSCNPSTLARDLVHLSKTYRVDYIQSVDMFPETARVEAVVKLSLR
ncbi:23S rRNA (uracil(1939)-C(5))-methyltransferase RlmD [Lacticaseibacillus hulanensis]|uniref:23S rRNA (uracil(1939)-C(5))-methyltransferase RlmD n=1 Tax=Lacticaseibacillus hulanensis TaxID=2493111 RepID=UPI000FD7DE65|nr:23S rRNA (uracil(1939)-C(5))-methyltransferase RlmD [Lacticaseibacillus hulanensis]